MNRVTGLEWYHYPEQYQQLLANTADHQLKIMHEDGLYRHLRFQKPGTGMWYWDLITWPGSLAIRGDIGEGFIFTRERDMLSFFDHGQPDGHINASYWAEKLDRGARSVREFSETLFREWLGKQPQDAGGLPSTLLAQVDEVGSTERAVELLDEYSIDWDVDEPESWKDYNWHFLLALHAVLWGAKRYHRTCAWPKSGDPS